MRYRQIEQLRPELLLAGSPSPSPRRQSLPPPPPPPVPAVAPRRDSLPPPVATSPCRSSAAQPDSKEGRREVQAAPSYQVCWLVASPWYSIIQFLRRAHSVVKRLNVAALRRWM
jgi:hypothetical protein